MTLLPASFISRMKNTLGDEFDLFISSFQNSPPISLRINPQKEMDLFKREEKVPWNKKGYYLQSRPEFVFDPLIHGGAFYVQEASSMFIENFPDFSKDLRILDLCAAPGGKSTSLLSSMSSGSILFSNEMVHQRAQVLYENLVKWGSPNVVVTYNKPEKYLSFTNYFDVVLVDAPCSGEGLFRKSPKYISEWRENKAGQCSLVQRNILDIAFSLVKEKGILIYSTCTFSPLENEEIVKWFYGKYKGYISPHHLDIPTEWNIKEELMETGDGKRQEIFKFYPHRLKGEGFFVTAFIKDKVIKNDHFLIYRQEKTKVADQLIKKEVEKFAEIPRNYSLICQEEKVFAIPSYYYREIVKASTTLNVLKSGVLMGTFNKRNGIFIPSHELVLSPFIKKGLPFINLEKTEAIKFLKKEEINASGSEGFENGWIIAKYSGLAIGWLKKSDKRLNNFYPKEWKIRKR